MDVYVPPTSLKALLETPKGHLDHYPDEAFLLHVFWEAPSRAAAETLLSGLRGCSVATHRDTPCVPTYFFRITKSNPLSPSAATVGAYPPLHDALKKLQVGIPKPVVRADLTRRGMNPDWVDLNLSDPLPLELRTEPFVVEFTEIYLDERSFMLHCGSKDYLDAYGIVTKPGLSLRPPVTTRIGSPSSSIVEKILEPILHERVVAVGSNVVWQRPPASPSTARDAVMLALDCTRHADKLPPQMRDACTTAVSFPHVLKDGITRWLLVLPQLPSTEFLAQLQEAVGPVIAGEAHTSEGDSADALRTTLASAGLLPVITMNGDASVGYVLHEYARDLHVRIGDHDKS
ncbi:hypothetical protein DYB34_007032 [Aphanomyces astaci]|uniref:Uncharacterized protein n=1 Tax=Aphanomyces astaci TaxID=112090 RepID=A0A418C6U4_APHAT|nr:hypothetical protein DYB34_007032 [Aphanomyces astaci]